MCEEGNQKGNGEPRISHLALDGCPLRAHACQPVDGLCWPTEPWRLTCSDACGFSGPKLTTMALVFVSFRFSLVSVFVTCPGLRFCSLSPFSPARIQECGHCGDPVPGIVGHHPHMFPLWTLNCMWRIASLCYPVHLVTLRPKLRD